jgi:putative membrane protein
MKRWTQAVLGICLATSLVACRGDNRANDADNTAAGREPGSAVGTAGANADRDFIEDQLEDGEAEVNLGRMASERATNPQVKEFAQMMVRDHQMAGEELRQVATAANVQPNVSAEPDRDHKNLQEELTKASGPDFDRKYIDAMVDEHQEAVNEIEKKQDSDNTHVKQWAMKTLPKVRQHLEQAKARPHVFQQRGLTARAVFFCRRSLPPSRVGGRLRGFRLLLPTNSKACSRALCGPLI